MVQLLFPPHTHDFTCWYSWQHGKEVLRQGAFHSYLVSCSFLLEFNSNQNTNYAQFLILSPGILDLSHFMFPNLVLHTQRYIMDIQSLLLKLVSNHKLCIWWYLGLSFKHCIVCSTFFRYLKYPLILNQYITFQAVSCGPALEIPILYSQHVYIKANLNPSSNLSIYHCQLHNSYISFLKF
jgi:hypothetical protein